MEWSLTQNKLLAFHRLMRTDKPIGALLLLWPTLWALWVATPGVPQLWILAVFVAGVWLMRAAGCVVNDYADRKFDGHVKRTANRPLPSGAVTEKEARALFVVLVLISFLLVLTLRDEGYISDSGDAEPAETMKVYQLLAELITSDVRLTIESATQGEG